MTSKTCIPRKNMGSLPFHIQQIISAIASLKYAAGLSGHIEDQRFSKKAVYALRPFIPYVVHATQNPGQYILLNRDYKPVGTNTFDMVAYDNYAHALFGLEELALFRLHYYLDQRPSNTVDGSFFMDDCPPWQSKQAAANLIQRLEHLVFTLSTGAGIL